jgi:hypothetical protein
MFLVRGKATPQDISFKRMKPRLGTGYPWYLPSDQSGGYFVAAVRCRNVDNLSQRFNALELRLLCKITAVPPLPQCTTLPP